MLICGKTYTYPTPAKIKNKKRPKSFKRQKFRIQSQTTNLNRENPQYNFGVQNQTTENFYRDNQTTN